MQQYKLSPTFAIILLCVIALPKSDSQNATAPSTNNDNNNNNSNESSSSNSSSSENSNSQEVVQLQPQQFVCLNARLVRFMQIGNALNENLLRCTSSLANLGIVAYDRLTDYNLQFDDLETSYALLVYCGGLFCQVQEAFNIASDIIQIAVDLDGLRQAMSTNNDSGNDTSGNGNGTQTARNLFPRRLNATEIRCVNNSLNNLTNVFNQIADCF